MFIVKSYTVQCKWGGIIDFRVTMQCCLCEIWWTLSFETINLKIGKILHQVLHLGKQVLICYSF